MIKNLNLLLIFFLSVTILTSCDDESENTQELLNDDIAPRFVVDPTIELDPNGNTPLAAELKLETDEPTFVTVNIIEADEAARYSETKMLSEINFDDLNTTHALPVLGFHPDSNYEIEVIIADQSGNQTIFENQLQVTTEPLPKEFPPFECEINNINKVEPGVFLFATRGRGDNNNNGHYILFIDNQCNLLWYYKDEGTFLSDHRRLKNGNLIFIRQPREKLWEIDMLGNLINEWGISIRNFNTETTIIVDTDAFHHEVFEMENGNFLVLSVELKTFENYPSSDSNPLAPKEDANVAGDVVVEFDRDGNIIDQWSLLDLLDPYRIGFGSLNGFWNSNYPEFTPTRDWSHGNAVIHDTSDNSIIVSLRSQDAVVKFSRDTGELIWILGTHDNWNLNQFGQYLLTPVGENFEWQYHQHAPMITPNGNILLFDNGNFRATPFDDPLPASDNYSRAVEYKIDEDEMLIEQVWEYGSLLDEKLYTPFIGDADILPVTKNVLITFGGITKDQNGIATELINGQKISAKILEVTHDQNPEVLFEINLNDDTPDLADGWQVYRSEKLPSLYP